MLPWAAGRCRARDAARRRSRGGEQRVRGRVRLNDRRADYGGQLGCRLHFTVDEAKREGRGHCSVPLGSIRVDNDNTKTEHFGQWATNKKMEPAQCKFDLEVSAVKLSPPVEPKKPVAFTTEGTFMICGRPREDHRPERIQGPVIYLPAGTYGSKQTLRIRARIEQFDREKYGVSPKNTAGWLARVQQLADVVGTEGTIDVNLFAAVPEPNEGEKRP